MSWSWVTSTDTVANRLAPPPEDERRLDESNESAVRLASLLADIDSNITLVLASTRVRLQNLELQTAITTLALAAGTALAGFFGTISVQERGIIC